MEIENVVQPGKRYRVDAKKFVAARDALLAALAPSGPGLTYEEMKRAAVVHLPADLFPGGAKAGWWIKAAQLDQEAKGTVVRTKGSPLRYARS